MPLTCKTCAKIINYYCYDTDLYTGKKFDIYFCDNCLIGTTILHKKFNFTSHYPKKYYGKDGKKFNFIAEFALFILRYLKCLSCYNLFNRKNVRLLDIGCGSGQFIYLMKKKGWLVNGTEASQISASAAKKKVGKKSILVNNNLEKLKGIKINFDIITFWHVLEHLKNPEKIFNLINKKLKKKGYIVIEVPNFESYQHSINKNNWLHLDCPRHLTHFTKEGLINLFDKKKFKLIKSSTLSFEFGFYGMFQSLLNLFVPIPNYFFTFIQKKNSKVKNSSFNKNLISFLITLFLFLPLSIISIILEFLAVILNKGGVLKIVIQKI